MVTATKDWELSNISLPPKDCDLEASAIVVPVVESNLISTALQRNLDQHLGRHFR